MGLLQLLLNNSTASLYQKNYQDYTALMIADKNDHHAAASFLRSQLKLQLQLQLVHHWNRTRISEGKKLTTALIDELYKIKDSKDTTTFSPLLERCSPSVINTVVKRKGVEVTPLIIAAALQMTVYAQLTGALLEKKASPDFCSHTGETALMRASKSLAKTQILLQHNANPNLQATDKNTALHYAARGGYQRTIFLLIQSNADINVSNFDKKTPLDTAVDLTSRDCTTPHRKARLKNTVTLLLTHKANPNQIKDTLLTLYIRVRIFHTKEWHHRNGCSYFDIALLKTMLGTNIIDLFKKVSLKGTPYHHKTALAMLEDAHKPESVAKLDQTKRENLKAALLVIEVAILRQQIPAIKKSVENHQLVISRDVLEFMIKFLFHDESNIVSYRNQLGLAGQKRKYATAHTTFFHTDKQRKRARKSQFQQAPILDTQALLGTMNSL